MKKDVDTDFDERSILDSHNLESIYQILIEESGKTGEIRRAFRKMLETYVPQVGCSAPEHPRILDLGCGECIEAHVLSGYFGGEPYGFASGRVLVVGIDIDEKKIARAKRNYSRFDCNEGIIKYIERPNFRFIHGDLIRLRELVDGEFDIVVARHPNVAEIPETWYTIFRESKGIMRPEGLFLATSFTDIEHEMLEELVQRAGFKIALSTLNMYAIPTSYEECSIDRNVLLAIA